MKCSIPLLFAMIWMVILPGGAAAHGTDYRVMEEGHVIAAEFFYSDREPMRYAEVLVFSPENKDVEHQNGRTDKNGRFAFCPEIPGKWLVKVNDGMGHAVRAEIEVDGVSNPRETAKGAAGNNLNAIEATSKWIRIFLGLSLLLNFCLGLYVWKTRSFNI